MKNGLKNIIFDFGGVIVDLDREGTARSFADQGVDVNRFLGLSKQSGIFGQLELGEITPEEFTRKLVAEAHDYKLEGKELTITEEGVVDAWNKMLVGIPKHRLDALMELSREYNISLLSNTNTIHWEYSLKEHYLKQGFDPEKVFQHIFLSQEMHLAKPGREIFEEVLKRSGYKAEETLFIDDSEANCQAFAQLGVKTFTPVKADDWLSELIPSVASIGFFDGVHKGHLCLIEQVKKIAKERNQSSLLITFKKHPRSVLQSEYVPELLSSQEEKTELLKKTGVSRIEMMDFTAELSQLSAQSFMKDILHDKLGVRVLVMGYDHKFGHGGGTWQEYLEWGKQTGIEVIRAEELEGVKVSSSTCRRLIKEGNVKEAAQLLGHHYTMNGKVVPGHQVGHELGFPTANLQPAENKLLPKQGVYAVWAELENGQKKGGMLHIGCRPTIDNGNAITIEVNLFDFEEDLYNKNVTIHFADYLREEKRFETREELTKQLEKDKEISKEIIKKHMPMP